MPTHLYWITCASTGNGYVGITDSSLARRFSKHCGAARAGKPSRLYDAMRRYGSDEFSISLLYTYSTRDDAYTAEAILVDALNLQQCGYNTLPGGDVLPCQLGRKRSTSTKARISASMRGRPSARRGLKHTAEAIARMSASKKGVRKPPRTDAHKKALAAALTGKKLSPETIARRQESRRRNRYEIESLPVWSETPDGIISLT